ncbi:hypothetical protein BX600DRAFT_151185 [Xylariales sp. PMI_506]|nr:hypothetical protein BX600DRAFT_151185 [Xylariales sp. PMI_506]
MQRREAKAPTPIRVVSGPLPPPCFGVGIIHIAAASVWSLAFLLIPGSVGFQLMLCSTVSCLLFSLQYCIFR